MPSYPTDNPDPSIYDVPVLSGTVPQKEEFMRHRNLKLAIEKLRAMNTEAIEFSEAGVSPEIIDALVTEINCALVVERNEAYIRPKPKSEPAKARKRKARKHKAKSRARE